jgi:hypothetical protein
MTQVSLQTNEISHAESTPGEGTRACEGGSERNGTAAGHETPAAKESSRVERAEILADQLGRKVATAAAVVGRGLFRFAARLREEAEDVWAEAQNIRRGNKS